MLVTTLPENLAVAQCRCRVILATILLSHAGDDAAGVTWPRRNEDAESCWLWSGCTAPEIKALRCCRIMKKSDIRVGL
jgi:hypothetical protein